MKLQGKKVLITGGSLRIGREIALSLAKRGMHVFIHYNKSRTPAEKLKKKIELLGEQATLIKADFSSRKTNALAKSFLTEIYKKTHSIDVLINNASIFYPTPLATVTEKDWDHFFTVNLKIPFFLSKEIGLKMQKKKSGKIINLVDYSVFRPHPDYLPYILSKAGLEAATRGLAKALAPHVQVNSIAPGPILPPQKATRARTEKVISQTLLKRYGTPQDIVATVHYLLEGTDFVTGAFLPVDGGSLIA